MTKWVPRFDYPVSEEWLLMDVNLPDAAERVAQQIAERGGRQNKRYAKTVRGHLERTWARAREDRIEPLVVYVPHVWRDVPGFTPSSVYTRPFIPDHERTMEAIMARARKPTDAPTEAEVTAVELPAGPACRVHEAFPLDTGHAGVVTVENVHYYVLAEEYPKEIVLFIADWATNALGPGMVELADQMAASLRFTPRGSDDKPRPVLAAPSYS